VQGGENSHPGYISEGGKPRNGPGYWVVTSRGTPLPPAQRGERVEKRREKKYVLQSV